MKEISKERREYLKAYSKKWRAENKEYIAQYNKAHKEKIAFSYKTRVQKNRPRLLKYWIDNRLKRTYGLLPDEVLALYEKYDHKCCICGHLLDGFNKCIDHDHAINQVRGILCRTCNLGLGHFKDNPELLSKAATYLRSCNSSEHSSS